MLKKQGMLYIYNKYSWLIKQLVQRDLKLKYKRSVLGYMWSLLQPLMMMAVMSIIFSQIFRYNVDNYSVYLICGNVIFTLFSEATSNSMNAIISSAGLIKKVYIPKMIFPLSKCIVSLVNFFYSLIAVIIILIAFRIEITNAILLFPIVVICVFFFSLGIGLILATAATFFRDVLYLYGILLQVWMYLTPIFYPLEALPIDVANVVKYNPLCVYLTYFRDTVMYGTIPTLTQTLVCVIWAVISMLLGIYVFNKNQKKFLLYI